MTSLGSLAFFLGILPSHRFIPDLMLMLEFVQVVLVSTPLIKLLRMPTT
jgi:hypothetical protein